MFAICPFQLLTSPFKYSFVWVKAWLRVRLVLVVTEAVKGFIVCWYLDPRCTSHVGKGTKTAKTGFLGGPSVPQWHYGRLDWMRGKKAAGRPVVVGGRLDDWGGQECPAASDRPPECQTVGFMGGGAWNPGQVPSPVVDNIHEGLPPSLSLSSTQEFTAPAVLLPATRLSIEIPVSDRTGACCYGWGGEGWQVWETLRKCVSIFPGYRG